MTDELLSNSVAAQVLAELVPGRTREQWTLWLQNNRNQLRRVSYRIPYERLAGGVFYRREELLKFSELEKGRQLGTIKLTGRAVEVMLALGVCTSGEGASGRKLSLVGIYPQYDLAEGRHWIQLILDHPLMIYRLEVPEARTVLESLQEAVRFCELRT